MLNEIVAKYLELFPEDRREMEPLLKQLEAGEDLSNRNNYSGHVAGGALVLSPDLHKVLLIYHPTFEKWMQPGGHLEPNEAGPWITAERETVEETGVQLGKRIFSDDERVPLLIESHLVPTKPPKNEPEHYHHGFWYVFVAKSEEIKLEDEVINEASWTPLVKIKDKKILKVLSRVKPLL